MKGNLVVITGPMYSRKSLQLIEEIKNWQYRDMMYMAFSPVRDQIFSRGMTIEIPAIHLHSAHPNLIAYMVGAMIKKGEEIKAVAIDEVSFYQPGIVQTVEHILANGIDVVVAGLDQDFRGKPFGSIGDLMALAVEVRKRYTICMNCKKNLATMTQRLNLNGTSASYDSPLIAVDGEEQFRYECRCKDCHERG